jgi:hypothetical protein
VRQILAALLVGHGAENALLQCLCTACAQALPVSGVGLTLTAGVGHGGTVASSDGPAAVLEDLQYDLGEGPCLDASRDGQPVLHSDLARTGLSRWPAFTAAAAESGIAAVFAFPLQVGAIHLGVLGLYRDLPGSLGRADLAEALAFAEAASTIVLHLQDGTPPGMQLHPRLADAVESRREVHQATGMITVQARVELTDAMLLLQGHAYGSGRPVLDVAQDVVARRLRFSPGGAVHD